MTSTDSWRPMRALALSGPGVLLGLLVPKCPLCVAAWLSALGVGGALAMQIAPWLRGVLLMAALLSAAVGVRELVVRRRVDRCCGGALRQAGGRD